MENFFYECRVYESVDDKSLYWVISEKSTESSIHVARVKGIIKIDQYIEIDH